MESGSSLHAEKKRDLYVKWMQVCASIKEVSSVMITVYPSRKQDNNHCFTCSMLLACFLLVFMYVILSLGIRKNACKKPSQPG